MVNIYCFVLVLILGLVSCTKNQLEEEKRDEWKLSPPEILLSEKSPPILVLENLRQVYPISASLRLSSSPSVQISDIRLEGTSDCAGTSGTIRAKKSLLLSGTDLIPLKSLLPQELVARLEFDSKQSITCDLKFKAINVLVGSTHEFVIPGLQINELSHLESLELTTPKGESLFRSSSLPDEIPLIDFDQESLPQLTQLTQPSKNPSNSSKLETDSSASQNITLICELFSNRLEFEQVTGMNSAFKLLVTGPLQLPNPHILTSSIDPRVSTPEQKCRLYYEALDSKTGLTDIKLSRSFIALFQAPINHLQFQLTFGDTTRPDFTTQTVFEVRFKNTSPVPSRYRIPLEAGAWFEFQPAYMEPNGLVSTGLTYSEPLYLEVEGAARQWPEPQTLSFEVLPEQEVIIRSRIKTAFNCIPVAQASIQQNLKLGHSALVGFRYRFLKPIKILQHHNPSATDLTAQTRTMDRTPMQLPMGKQGNLLEGWVPLSQWIFETGGKAITEFRSGPTPRTPACDNIYEPLRL